MVHPTFFKRCFNLWKADGNGYSVVIDKLIEDVEFIPEKYGGFVENMCVASRRYIPGLSEESKSLYQDYKKTVCK